MANQTKSDPISHMATQIDHAPVNYGTSNNLVVCSKCKTEYKQGTTHNCSRYGSFHQIPSYLEYTDLW